ncbi:MAG: carbon storage regulator [Gammaproteobacteria bacterium]
MGPDIVVTLVAIERKRARIGVDAPRDITIDREEVAEKKRLEQLDTNAATDESDDEGSDGNRGRRQRKRR